MELNIACATDDGQNFIDRHFGDADYYYIYSVSGEKAEFINKINNTSIEEKQHADPRKAKSVLQILKSENVHCGVSCAFGPNIKRVKKHIVPIIIKEKNIESGLEKLKSNFDRIKSLWEKGKQREHLVIN
ncbi:MAG: NifB/NifX family molybdenum-iron cluster-binding protein [Bacillota bacterium]